MHPRRTLSRLAALLLAALLAACATTPVPRRLDEAPAAPAPRTWASTVAASGGGWRVEGEARRGPVMILAAAGWPDGAPEPPVVAVGLADGEGGLHLLASRGEGATAGDAAAPLAAAPRDDPRPLAALGTFSAAEGLKVDLRGAVDGDQALLFAADATEPLQGLLGTARREGGGWSLQLLRPALPASVLVVRIGHLDPALGELAVPAEATCLPAVPGVRWTPPAVPLSQRPPAPPLAVTAARCEGDALASVTLEAPEGVLRTPLWAPRRLTLEGDDLALLQPLLALRSGAADHAAGGVGLLAPTTPSARLLRAALLLELGLPSVVQAALEGLEGEEPARLRAGLALRAGDPTGARDALASPGAPLLSGAGGAQPLRVAQLLTQHPDDPAAAAAALLAELPAAPSPERVPIGSAAVLASLSADQPSEALRLARALDKDAADDEERAQTLQLVAFALLGVEDPRGAAAALEEALPRVIAYQGEAERARVLRLLASLQQPASAEQARSLRDASEASLASRDLDLIAEAAAAEWLAFAEEHAAAPEPPPDAAARLQRALEATRRADRLDLAARCARYGVLLLPASADIEARARAARELLPEAIASHDPGEIAIAYLLMARVERARFRYTESQALYDLSIDFSDMLGDDAMTASIEDEAKEVE